MSIQTKVGECNAPEDEEAAEREEAIQERGARESGLVTRYVRIWNPVFEIPYTRTV